MTHSILERLKNIVTKDGFVPFETRFNLVLRAKINGKLAELVEETAINVDKLEKKGFILIRRKLEKELKVNTDELKLILRHLRIIEGRGQYELVEELNVSFKFLGIDAIDKQTKIIVPHISLIRNLYMEKNVIEFTLETLTFHLEQERLYNGKLRYPENISTSDVFGNFQLTDIRYDAGIISFKVKCGIINSGDINIDSLKIRYFISNEIVVDKVTNAMKIADNVDIDFPFGTVNFDIYHYEYKPALGSINIGENKTISLFETIIPKHGVNSKYLLAWQITSPKRLPCLGSAWLKTTSETVILEEPRTFQLTDEHVKWAAKKASGLDT